jgi:hypothetical protein
MQLKSHDAIAHHGETESSVPIGEQHRLSFLVIDSPIGEK